MLTASLPIGIAQTPCARMAKERVFLVNMRCAQCVDVSSLVAKWVKAAQVAKARMVLISGCAQIRHARTLWGGVSLDKRQSVRNAERLRHWVWECKRGLMMFGFAQTHSVGILKGLATSARSRLGHSAVF